MKSDFVAYDKIKNMVFNPKDGQEFLHFTKGEKYQIHGETLYKNKKYWEVMYSVTNDLGQKVFIPDYAFEADLELSNYKDLPFSTEDIRNKKHYSLEEECGKRVDHRTCENYENSWRRLSGLEKEVSKKDYIKSFKDLKNRIKGIEDRFVREISQLLTEINSMEKVLTEETWKNVFTQTENCLELERERAKRLNSYLKSTMTDYLTEAPPVD